MSCPTYGACYSGDVSVSVQITGKGNIVLSRSISREKTASSTLDTLPAQASPGVGKNVRMKKHTPGPWVLGEPYGFNGEIRSVFACDETKEIGPTSIACALEADARLIAAAPELLEVALLARGMVAGIKDGLRNADKELMMETVKRLNDWERQINEAIAKAQADE